MRQNARWRCGGLSALLTALWLGVLLAGSSPQIHHLLHADAHAPEHSCAIEHFSHSSVLFSPEAGIVVPPEALSVSAQQLRGFLCLSCGFLLPLSRGPPSFANSQAAAG